jgi:recombinational DNA repair ATPase RecF
MVISRIFVLNEKDKTSSLRFCNDDEFLEYINNKLIEYGCDLIEKYTNTLYALKRFAYFYNKELLYYISISDNNVKISKLENEYFFFDLYKNISEDDIVITSDGNVFVEKVEPCDTGRFSIM